MNNYFNMTTFIKYIFNTILTVIKGPPKYCPFPNFVIPKQTKNKETCRVVWIYLEMIAQCPTVRVINEIKTTVLPVFIPFLLGWTDS